MNDRSVVPPPALISVVKAPLTTLEGPIPCYGLKSGSASDSFYVYEYLFTGISATVWTATLEKAMKNGGITKLHYADYDMSSFLKRNLFWNVCLSHIKTELLLPISLSMKYGKELGVGMRGIYLTIK